jgi:hypothetical protein
MAFGIIFTMFIFCFALSYYVLGAVFDDINGEQIYPVFASLFNSYELSTGQ